MPGARIVLNSRYFHVAKPGEKLSKNVLSGEHVGQLVEYCGTRETVALNISEKTRDLPATEKQIETIEEFALALGDEYKNTLEYDDYIKAPTRINASELISRMSELIMMNNSGYDFDEAANLIEYAAKRPGAIKVGDHGLFSSYEDVDLQQAKEEISTHQGNIWTHIFSLRREDADFLGYDSQKPWRSLVMSHIDDIAKAHRIKPENLRWYGAMHNTAHHPHIHLFVYSTDPKEGFLNKEDISNLKSRFANDIFKDELIPIFKQKDEYQKQLEFKVKDVLNELLQNPEASFNDGKLNEIANKMLTLSQAYKGSAKYGYQTKEVKALVDNIQHLLISENPVLSELYAQWCEQQFNIEQIYIKDPNKDYPIENNSSFITVKNHILRQAQAIRDGVTQPENSFEAVKTKIENDNTEEFTHKTVDYNSTSDYVNKYSKKHPEHIFLSAEPTSPETKSMLTPDFIFESDNDTVKDFKSLYILANDLSTRDGEICRKLADCYNYGKGVEKDISQAVMWYGISADQFKDSMASYRLGQIYLYGHNEIEIDKDLGNYYCKQAFYLFRNEIKNFEFFYNLEEGQTDLSYYTKVSREDAYKEYLLGRMYLKGEGVEQDYYKAFQSFNLSAENGYSHSYYYIGNQYYYGLGFEQDYQKALSYYFKASEAKDNYADYRIAKMYLKGEGINVNSEKAEEYLLKSVNKVPLANYDLAKLYEDNSDKFNISNDRIYSLYQNALKALIEQEKEGNDAFSEMRIADMYINGKGTKVNIMEAVKWLEKSAQQNNPDAYYQLGYIYSLEEHSFADIAKSNEYYKCALIGYEKAEDENSNATAEYRIGLIHLNGLGVDKNIDKALSWFEKSTINGNHLASYKLATIYDDDETSALYNPKMALLSYQLSAKLGNPYAIYKLGNIALDNNDVPQAIEYFEQSADKNISHAWYKLGEIYSNDEYNVFDMEKANFCFNKALNLYITEYAENPNDFTAYRLGQMYLNAQGTTENISEAILWFTKSVELGNPDADYQLGYIYQSDKYGVQNNDLSIKHFTSALSEYKNLFNSDPTNGDVAMRIGTFYHYGLGVEHDIEKALSWYKKSVELGNEKAKQKIDEAQQIQQLSIMAVASTACHLGRMINTETVAAIKNRYVSDSKLLRKEKIQKIQSGHAINDSGQSYDY